MTFANHFERQFIQRLRGAASRPSSHSILQYVNLSKLLLNSLNAPRPMRILGSGLRTHDGRPALVAGRHDSDRHLP